METIYDSICRSIFWLGVAVDGNLGTVDALYGAVVWMWGCVIWNLGAVNA